MKWVKNRRKEKKEKGVCASGARGTERLLFENGEGEREKTAELGE